MYLSWLKPQHYLVTICAEKDWVGGIPPHPPPCQLERDLREIVDQAFQSHHNKSHQLERWGVSPQGPPPQQNTPIVKRFARDLREIVDQAFQSHHNKTHQLASWGA
jgi:hypothetical protein